MNRLVSSVTVALLAATVLSIPLSLSADIWKGGSSLNWSDPANWDVSVPGSSDTVYFSDVLYAGYTNAAGAVNNIVDSSMTVGAMICDAISSNNAATPKHFYTTLIPANKVLTLAG